MEKQILEWLWSFWLGDSEANDWEGGEGYEGKKTFWTCIHGTFIWRYIVGSWVCSFGEKVLDLEM